MVVAEEVIVTSYSRHCGSGSTYSLALTMLLLQGMNLVFVQWREIRVLGGGELCLTMWCFSSLYSISAVQSMMGKVLKVHLAMPMWWSWLECVSWSGSGASYSVDAGPGLALAIVIAYMANAWEFSYLKNESLSRAVATSTVGLVSTAPRFETTTTFLPMFSNLAAHPADWDKAMGPQLTE